MGYRKIFAFAVLITAACSWNGAPATADIRNAPPAPSISFTVQPRFQSVRGTQVYTWSNDPGRYNIYRFGGVYYLSSDGWWYRSGSMTGPYDVVEEVTIPRQVVMAYSPGDQYNGDPYNGDQGNAYNDDYDDRYAPNPPRITVSGNPQFLTVPGTSASFWVNGMSGYPTYRYNGSFYLSSGRWWYRSDDVRGPYYSVGRAAVPQQVTMAVDYRTRYGDQWAYRNSRDYRSITGAPVVVFQERPRFVRVPNSNVEYCVNQRGDYELYRYGGDYYINNNGTWYRSDYLRGPYRVSRSRRMPQPVFAAADFVMRNGDDWTMGRKSHRHGGY
jgi:hypothetical protein